MRSPTISMRIPRADKEWLTRAAGSAGQSLSEFLRTAAIKEAHRVVDRGTREIPVVRVKMGRQDVER